MSDDEEEKKIDLQKIAFEKAAEVRRLGHGYYAVRWKDSRMLDLPAREEPAREAAEGAEEERPRVPKRPADRRKWRAVWDLIESEVGKGKSYADISAWLERSHPELAYSERVISDIVAAGEAGLLSE